MAENENLPAKGPQSAFTDFMEKIKPQMALALPKHFNVDRMVRLSLTAFSTTKALQACTMQSIAGSIMTAAQLGLEPGVNGAGFLVPYKTTCTFIPGWKGLVDLVSRSGRGTVYSGVIFSDQKYTFSDGSRRELIIHNETDLYSPDDITHAYAIGWVKGSDMAIIELWRVSKIKQHRDKYNKVGTKHYSFKDWEMYARKVPLLQVMKYMPCSIEISNAIAISNASEAGRMATIEDGVVIDLDAPEEFSNQAENVRDRFKENATSPQAGNDILQECYKAITALAEKTGDTPDDTLSELTKGKLTVLIDLETRSTAYVNDIMMLVQAELNK